MSKPLGVAGKAVIRKEDKILLVQRPPDDAFDPNLWELPGGKLEYGEDLIESLKREVEEEVDLQIEVKVPFKTWHFYKKPYWVTGVTFICDYMGGSVKLSPEHQAYKWIDPKDYLEYPLSTTVKEQIEAYLKLDLNS